MKKLILASTLLLTVFSVQAQAATKKGGVCWAGGGSDKFSCSCIDEQGLTVDQIYAKGFKVVAIHPDSTKASTKIYIEQQ
ncbi:hypothetical protein KWF73_18425 [Acinetobacter pittii]|uniref:hypothetical protein n=1 Tax=Acinetobacter calcoaceticus/baumannii complex TaxID=909768 RepID=UPI0034CFC1D8